MSIPSCDFQASTTVARALSSTTAASTPTRMHTSSPKHNTQRAVLPTLSDSSIRRRRHVEARRRNSSAGRGKCSPRPASAQSERCASFLGTHAPCADAGPAAPYKHEFGEACPTHAPPCRLACARAADMPYWHIPPARREAYRRSSTGFSMCFLNELSHAAPMAPSTTRWSAERDTAMTDLVTNGLRQGRGDALSASRGGAAMPRWLEWTMGPVADEIG